MATTRDDTVAERADWWHEQRPAWDLARTLLGGTEAMRKAGVTFLPKFPDEEDPVYAARLERATLNNFYRRTAKEALGLIFAKPVKVVDSRIPEAILLDVDRQGRGVSDFARAMALPFLTRGLHHAFVDAPRPAAEPETLEDDLRNGLRPYWVSVPAELCINAFCTAENGVEELTHVRFVDNKVVRAGFIADTIERIRVFELMEGAEPGVGWSLWQKTVLKASAGAAESESWVQVDEGRFGRLSKIAWTTFYAERTAFMTSASPLSDVAHKNVEHWQSSADQRNILTVSRYPIQYQIGTEKAVAVTGPYKALHSPGRQAKDGQDVAFGYIEPACTGVLAGERDLDRIEKEAEALGRQLRVRAAQTKIEATQNAAEAASPLQEFVGHLEIGLNEMLRHTAVWLGIDPAEAGRVEVNRDFGLTAEEQTAIDALLAIRAAGDMSRESFLLAMRDKGVLPADFDVEAEDARVGQEMPALALPAPADNVGDV